MDILYTVAICDDEEIFLTRAAEEIQRSFERMGCACRIERFSCAEALRRRVTRGGCFDAVFLDLQMPGLSGLQLAVYLREMQIGVRILFVSSHEQMVFETFQVQPFRFIRKQFFFDEIESSVGALIGELSAGSPENLLLEVNAVYVMLNPYTIHYVECKDKTLTFATELGNIQVKYKLRELEARLEGLGFLRIHKGFLVNYRYIFSIGANEVTLDSGKSLPVSRYRLTEVKQQYRRCVV